MRQLRYPDHEQCAPCCPRSFRRNVRFAGVIYRSGTRQMTRIFIVFIAVALCRRRLRMLLAHRQDCVPPDLIVNQTARENTILI